MKILIKNILINAALFIFGCFLAFIAGEIILRIYNPLPLPYKNSLFLRNSYTIRLKNTKGLNDIDDTIVVNKNQCGFRGPELGSQYKTKILFVGGSTTECLCVSDGKDWPGQVGKKLNEMDPTIWVNNAGMGGNSTYGHLILMDHVVKKISLDYACFMVGINDARIRTIRQEDKGMFAYFDGGWRSKLLACSRLMQTIKFLIGVKEAYRWGINDQKVDFKSIEILSQDKDSIQNEIKKLQKLIIRSDEAYEKRIQQLIDLCNRHHIKPVFIAQTTAFGFLDPGTGKDLSGFMKVKSNSEITGVYGKYAQEQNSFYNDLTRKICIRNKLDFIELDSLIRKDSRNFYDFVHLNNKGCSEVAKIITPELIRILIRDNKMKLLSFQ